MKTNNAWQQDSEYVAIVEDLLAQPAVQRLAEFTQHHHSNRLDHSIAVSYDSYVLAKKWHLNTTAVARGGLLHDLFYYEAEHEFFGPLRMKVAKQLDRFRGKVSAG